MQKKIWKYLVLICLVISSLPFMNVVANTDDFNQNEITYNYATTFNLSDWVYVDDGTTIILHSYKGLSKDVYVPGEHNGKQVNVLKINVLNNANIRTLRLAEVNKKKVKSTTTDASSAFTGSQIKQLDLRGLDVSNITDANAMFSFAMDLKELDVSGWNTSKISDMNFMFFKCIALQKLDLRSWNTTNVVDTSNMFFGCEAIKTIDVSNWNTANVTNMSNMFTDCNALIELNINNWNTQKVTDMSSMFFGCTSLVTLDLNKWDTSNVTSIWSMFSECEKLKELVISNWNISKVTDLAAMFAECNRLEKLDISKWNVTKVNDMTGLFFKCDALKIIDLSNWVLKANVLTDDMFYTLKKVPLVVIYKGNDPQLIKYDFEKDNRTSGNVVLNAGVGEFSGGAKTKQLNATATNFITKDLNSALISNTTYNNFFSNNIPTRNGYIFEKWDHSKKVFAGSKHIVELNDTFHAVWKVNPKKLTISNDSQMKDNILKISRVGKTNEKSLLYPNGYNSDYAPSVKLDNKLPTTTELKDITWKIESAGNFSNKLEYASFTKATTKVIAKKSGVIKLTATYKDSSASIYVVIPGDVSRDGVLNTADAIRIQKYASNKKPQLSDLGTADKFTLLLADMNGDDKVNTADKVVIQKMVSKMIEPSN